MKKISKNNKNFDNIYLLISYEKFQDEINKIRARLEIPQDGIVNDDEIKNWHANALQKSDDIMDSVEFKEKEREIMNARKNKKISPKQAKEQWHQFAQIIPYNYLQTSVKRLITEFNLPKNYELFLRNYIISNRITFIMRDNFSITPSKDKRSISVNVYTRLTDEDLQEIKNSVNQYYGKQLPFIQKVKNIPQKLEVENLHKNRIEKDLATGETYKLTNEDIAERVYDDPSKEVDTYETSRGLKRLRQSRFSSRKTIG